MGAIFGRVPSAATVKKNIRKNINALLAMHKKEKKYMDEFWARKKSKYQTK